MKYISRIEKEYNRRSDLIPIIEDLITEVQNLKTSPNKDFTAQSVSPKVCPRCGGKGEREINGIYVRCAQCKGSGKPS